MNEWHNLVLTWNRQKTSNTTLQIFVNEQLADSVSWNHRQWVPPGQTFYPGGGCKKNTKRQGIWNDIAVFDKVLSLNDIRVILTDGVEAACTAWLGTDRDHRG